MDMWVRTSWLRLVIIQRMSASYQDVTSELVSACMGHGLALLTWVPQAHGEQWGFLRSLSWPPPTSVQQTLRHGLHHTLYLKHRCMIAINMLTDSACSAC